MAEIKVTDLAEETAESLDGSESFVMFDNTSGKRGTVTSIGAYVLSKLTTKLGGISRTVSAAIESIESTLSAHASAISSKQDKLTFDSSPASGSKNPVTSGGIYSALIGKQNAGDYATTSALAKKQDKLTYDSAPTSGSSNPVTSDGIYSALAGKQATGDYATHGDLSTGLAGKQDKLTFDATPTASSTKPVTSGGVKAALDKKQDKLSIDSTPTSGSGNPVSSGGVASALAQKQDTIGASTALAAASLAVTGNVAGATFNGHALGDLLLAKLFTASVTTSGTSGNIQIPYTIPGGYKTVGALYARPTNFVGGAYVAFINSGTLDCWYFSAPANKSITVGAYLLFIRDI